MNPTKRSVIATVVAAVLVAASPSFAEQGRGGGGGPKTHPTKATGGGGTHTTVAKGPGAGTVQHGAPKSPKTTSPKTTSTMAGGTAGKGPKTTTTSPKSGTGSANAKGKSTTTTASTKTTASKKETTTTSASPTRTPSSTTTLTPVQQKLQRNTNLAGKLETRLPKGTDLMTAAEGFRNLGQFVAAVNVSNNLGIDFVNLKTSMVDDGLSLGQAIQTWKPTANSTQQASLAESQATVLINTSSTTTTGTPKTRKPKSTSGGELND